METPKTKEEIIVEEVNQNEKENSDNSGKKVNKRMIIVAICIVITIAIVGVLFLALGGKPKRIEKQLEIANNYLIEYEYEQAVVAFTAVIDIDPQNVEAYLGLFEAFIELNDYDTAYEWVKRGYELTQDPLLKEKMDMIDSGSIYDAKGRIHLGKAYDGNGKLIGMARYIYDRDRTEKVERLTADGTVAFTIFYEYDSKGRETKSFGGWRGGFEEIYTQIKTYNAKGQIVSIHYESESGKSFDETYSYDELGREVSKHVENLIEGKSSDWTYSYDELGRLASAINDCRVKFVYFYPDDQKEYYTRSECYPVGGSGSYIVSSRDYIYDENDRCIEEIYYDQGGKINSREVYNYDENGKCIETTIYDSFEKDNRTQ